MSNALPIAVASAALIALSCSTERAAGRSQPEAAGSPIAPPSPPPNATPPPPPTAGGLPEGQWVYTQQYGWVWMTYGDAFTYVPPGGSGEPLEYLYEPTYGWVWVVSPWVWGVGPWPYFGRRGPSSFAWYRHGWWRTPSRWRYRPAPARGEPSAHGIRPAPPRGERRARGGAYEPRGRERD